MFCCSGQNIAEFSNGETFFEAFETTEMTVDMTEKAAYRIEVYCDDLGSHFDKTPWIMSNPIYVR